MIFDKVLPIKTVGSRNRRRRGGERSWTTFTLRGTLSGMKKAIVHFDWFPLLRNAVYLPRCESYLWIDAYDYATGSWAESRRNQWKFPEPASRWLSVHRSEWTCVTVVTRLAVRSCTGEPRKGYGRGTVRNGSYFKSFMIRLSIQITGYIFCVKILIP